MFKQEKDDSDCNNEFDRNIVQTFRYIHARHSGCVAHFQHDYLSVTLEKKSFSVYLLVNFKFTLKSI